jgi:methionyl aminopeptidase
LLFWNLILSILYHISFGTHFIHFLLTAQCLNWPDDWTATTVDGKRTAQFEHTLLISKEGVEALTGKIETSPIQFWEKESDVHKGIWLGTTPAARARAAELSTKNA